MAIVNYDNKCKHYSSEEETDRSNAIYVQHSDEDENEASTNIEIRRDMDENRNDVNVSNAICISKVMHRYSYQTTLAISFLLMFPLQITLLRNVAAPLFNSCHMPSWS